ncbi:MAG TPA: PAS domain S-box protein [Candidatus Sulfotelmatobacter sp.]|nr:PAS domain S-box protein [Candidatus Sulfotelmatobacter sp.]
MTTSPGTPDFFRPSLTQTRQILATFLGFGAVLLILLTFFRSAVFSERYMPHAFCYLEKPALIWTHVLADLSIGLSYTAISMSLGFLLYKGRHEIPFRWMFVAFGVFIIACGGTHFIETVTVWVPVYVFAALVKIFTALASVCTAVVLPFTIPDILDVLHQAKTSESRRRELEVVLEERNEAQLALRKSNRQLEEQVKARTLELMEANSALQTELSERKRLAAIVESSDDAIIGKDLNGVITSWNRGAEKLYGYRAEEAIGQHIELIVPSHLRHESAEIMDRLSRGEHLAYFATERVTKSGQLLDVSLSLSPVFDAAEKIVGASAIARDITNAKRTEDALRESEAQYRLLFDRNPLPMWIFDRKSLQFRAVNQAAVQHYGYSRDEFLRMTILDIRPEEEVPALLKELSRPTEGLQEAALWKHRKKDGSVIDVEITACDLSIPTPNCQLVLVNDVTERLRNERKLRQSEERFSKAFTSSPIAITISTESESRYVDANPAFLAMMGYEYSELVGRKGIDLGVWYYPEERALMLEQLDAPKPAKPLEVSFRTKSGKVRVVELSAERITLGDQACILAVIHDVTEQKQLKEQFLQAQKMEAIGRLAGGVAHDFNNMLGVIIGYSELAMERLQSDEVTRGKIAEIRKSADRATGLVRQLLTFSRQQKQVPRTLNLNAVVQNLTKMLSHMIGEDVSLDFRPTEPLGSVRVDLGQIEQVLMNLSVNARDAMPTGGKLLIETANVVLDDAYIGQQGPVKPGSYVLLSVSDTGTGMNPETLSRAFEPFFTTKERGKGTGLGLATVWGIVNQSDGYISVYSDEGHGTTFKIYLPRVDQPAESLVPPEVKIVPPSGHETILLVEDDEALRDLTLTVLQSKGYRVLAARTGRAALELVGLFTGKISLLLTDVIMPEMTGPELAAEMQIRRPGIRVLYMSGYAKNFVIDTGMLGASSAMLVKPFSSLELLTKVRAALGGDESQIENPNSD